MRILWLLLRRTMNRWSETARKVSRVRLAITLLLMPWGTLSSSVPTPPSCAWFLHVSALAGLTVLVFLAFETAKVRIWAVTLIFLYSALLEVLQHFNPARHGTIEDVLANALGCVGGLVLWFAASRIWSVVSENRQAAITGRMKPEENVE